MDLEVDIVREGETPLRGEGSEYDEDAEDGADSDSDEDDVASQPIAVEINLAAGARYRATGKRKTSVARVILKPGTGAYLINGRTLEQHFPRFTLQRNIRQPLETVGYQERMDVVAKIHGGGVSAQAGALRHGVSRALIDADPNLRSELKRRGFLTRDPRVEGAQEGRPQEGPQAAAVLEALARLSRRLFGTDGVRGVAGEFLTADLALVARARRDGARRVSVAPRARARHPRHPRVG